MSRELSSRVVVHEPQSQVKNKEKTLPIDLVDMIVNNKMKKKTEKKKKTKNKRASAYGHTHLQNLE